MEMETKRMITQLSFRLCEDDLSTLEEAKDIAESIREECQYLKEHYPQEFDDKEDLEGHSASVWATLCDFLSSYERMRKRVMG